MSAATTTSLAARSGWTALGSLIVALAALACSSDTTAPTETTATTGSGGHPATGQGGSGEQSGAGGIDGVGGVGGVSGTGGVVTTGGSGAEGGTIMLSQPVRWRSTMYPENWTPADTDSVGRFVHDFSYAGYHKGEEPIPDIITGVSVTLTAAPYGADPTGVADSTGAIQQAIDDVGTQGGGVVLLPAGIYRVKPTAPEEKAALYIKHDGVVVRGEGRDKTFIFNDDSFMRGRSVLYLSPPQTPSWWFDQGDEVLLTADATNRTTTLTVADSSAYAVGDWIVVRSDATDEWVADHDMTGLWTQELVRGPMSLRQISAINGAEMSIDIPLRYPLLTRDNARILRARAQLQEVGLEDFSIAGRQHPGSSFGDTDYQDEGTAAWDVHGAWLITLLGVVDGWVRRVGSYRPPSNTGGYHSVSNGLRLYHTRNVTIEDVMIHHPQYEGGGGNGYPFLIQGSDNLLVDCAAVSGRHSYSLKSMTTSANVLLESSTSHPRYGTDFHMHLAMSNLIDSLVLEEDYIDATYRPYGGSIHGYTTTQTVLWNSRGLGYHGSKNFIVDSRQFNWGLAIGTEGAAPGIKTLPTIDEESTKDTAPEDFQQGDGHGGTLEPQSLYRDQLARRLNGGTAPSYLAEVEILAAVDDTYTRGGNYDNDNYGSEDLLHVKDASDDFTRHSFLKFDLSSIERPIAKAVLLVYGRTADQSGTTGDLRVHGVGDDSWLETSTTYSNQPALGLYLAKMVVDDTNRWRALDVTRFVRTQQYGDGIASLALTQQMGGDGRFVRVASKEAAANPPKLEIVLGPADALSGISASGAVTDLGTAANNAIDGDLSSRWANEDHGAALTVDLGASYELRGAGLGLYQGDQRIAFFELRASMNGSDWTTVYAGQSRGDTNSHQFFYFPETDARYLRYVGFGNSMNDWNSVTELLAYGK